MIAAWLVWMCLRVIATDLMYGLSWHNLKVEAHTLRIKQMDELRAIKESVFRKAAQSRGLDYDAMHDDAASTSESTQSSESVLEEDGSDVPLGQAA